MSTPVVVQGTAVDFGSSPQPVSSRPPEQGAVSHEPSSSGCKDPIFAVLFYVNIVAIAAVAVIYGPDAFSDSAEFTYEGYIYCTLIVAVISFLASAIGLAVLMAIPETMIKVSLIFVVVLSGIWAVMAILSGSLFAGVIGILFFAIGVCYARAVWGR